MGKSIWVVILIVVIALLWFLFKGDSSETPVDETGDTTEQTDQDTAAAEAVSEDEAVENDDETIKEDEWPNQS